MTDRGKRRSLAQRIGQKGEAIFSEWAVENGLTRQKVDDDFGIDFFCQVMASVDDSLEEVTGSVIAVQVRSVEGKKRKRVKLDRFDVESALRLQMPFCLIGVDTATRMVHYRFLDEDFLEELHSFLQTSHKSKTFQLSSMSNSMDDFARGVAEVTRPGYQQRLRWKKGASDIEQAIPGGRLILQQNLDGGKALVTAPWITSMFEVKKEAQDELASDYFETGEFPFEKEGIELGAAVANVTKLVDGSTLLAGAEDAIAELEVEHGTCYAKTTCTVRRLGDETAYITPSGLILSFSARRPQGTQWVHKMSHSVARVQEVAIGERESELKFLKLMVEGAELGEPGCPRFPINYWNGLHLLGNDVETIEKVLGHLNVDLDNIYLRDLFDVEFMLSVDLVRAFMEDVPMASYVPAFVLDDGGGDPASAESWVKAGVEAPLVANLKEQGIVVWFKGECSLYRRPDQLIAGFRMGGHSEWSAEVVPDRFKKSRRPELWLLKEWPAIQVMTPIDEIEDRYVGGQELEFGGDVWPLE